MDPYAQVDKRPEMFPKRWRFDDTIAGIFDDHVRKSVPFYDEIHRMVAEISDWFLADSSIVYDLGTSTGEGILRVYERHASKKLRFIAVDSSEPMLEKARTKLLHVPNVQFILHDLNNSFQIDDANLVLSVLTLQFLEPKQRPRLLKEIFDGLSVGGALILVEKLTAGQAAFEDMWTELYYDMKRRNGFSDYDIYSKSLSLRGVLIPYSLKDNIRLLRQTGFERNDVFFKWCNWAGILAIK